MKLIPHEVILVESIPNCDFCAMDGVTMPGPYDFKTVQGPWAHGCKHHYSRWALYKNSLGTGMGQLWVTADQLSNGALTDPRV